MSRSSTRARLALAAVLATALAPLATVHADPLPPLAPHPCGNAKAPSGAQCASLSVPLDDADAGAGRISIEVIRVPAADTAHRIGALFVNPGGPGASGVDFVGGAWWILQNLNQRFDIVGVDPRGVSDPQPVRCETTAQLDQFVDADPIADDSAEHAVLVSLSQQLAAGCAQRSGRLLPHVTTREVAQDMDRVRAALGESQISYLGFSYGTVLGVDYAQLFPGRLRAMVLDGDVDPSLTPLQLARQQADSFEASLQSFYGFCDSSTHCPLYPDAASVIDGVLTTLDTQPATVGGRSYGRGSALLALQGMMYTPPAWFYDAQLWAAAARGDDSGLAWLTDSFSGRGRTGYDPSLESGTAVQCADHEDPGDPASIDQAAAAAGSADPHFGAAAIEAWLPCSFWPLHGPAAAPVHLAGLPPVLLVGGLGDPATPYQWSLGLQQQIDGSVLLTRQGHGHPSYLLNTCVRGDVDAYLTTLATPPPDTVCPPG